MCTLFPRLFGIEKVAKDFRRSNAAALHLRLADFFLFWAETDYPLPLATLFSNFSTAKKLHSKERKQKPFAAQTPQRKRGYVGDFTLKSVNAYPQLTTPPKSQKSSFRTIHKAVLRNRRATRARMGLVSK